MRLKIWFCCLCFFSFAIGKLSIAKEKIERSIISKEQILHWLSNFGAIDRDDTAQKQRLINTFVNSVYVYDGKMVALFNYKDGEQCLTFDQTMAMLAQKQNPDNHAGYRGSPLSVNGGALAGKDELMAAGHKANRAPTK